MTKFHKAIYLLVFTALFSFNSYCNECPIRPFLSPQVDHNPMLGSYILENIVGTSKIKIVNNDYQSESIIVNSKNRLRPDHKNVKAWLIKNTGHLPRHPKIKDIVELGRIRIGLPLKETENGQVNSIVISYRPLNKFDGTGPSVLSDIEFYDHNGNKISSKLISSRIVTSALNFKGKDSTYFIINNERIDFIPRISAIETQQYQKFFKLFFYNPGKEEGFSKSVLDLNFIDITQINNFERKLRFITKPKLWLSDRLSKQFVNITVTTLVAISAPGIYRNFKSSILSSNNDVSEIEEDNSHKTYTVIGLVDSISKKKVQFIMKEAMDGGYVFLIPEDFQNLYKTDHNFEDESGQIMRLKYVLNSGDKYGYFLLKDH